MGGWMDGSAVGSLAGGAVGPGPAQAKTRSVIDSPTPRRRPSPALLLGSSAAHMQEANNTKSAMSRVLRATGLGSSWLLLRPRWTFR
jgi:hypothetical protein